MPRKTTINLTITTDTAGKRETETVLAEIVVNDDGSFNVGANQAEGVKLRTLLNQAVREAWPFHRVHSIFVQDNHESPVYVATNTMSTHLVLGDLLVASNDLTDDRRQRLAEAAEAAKAAEAAVPVSQG